MPGFSEEVAAGLTYVYEGEPLAVEHSAFQDIGIYEHPTFGRVLVLDGLVQTTTEDEFVYHEMLVHVPLLSLPSPRSVLVIGGGDGGTLRRVLEHPVERALMIEIDERVTVLCRELMPSIAGDAWGDRRAQIRFEDGIRHVHETDETFDAILIDSSDPVGPGEALFTEGFYRAARARLRPGGVLAAQSGSPYFQQDELSRAYANASRAFPDVRVYLANVPTYPGVVWSFFLAGEHLEPAAETAAVRAAERGIETRYWTPAVHRGAFDLPRVVLDAIAPDGPPHTFGRSPEERARGAVPRG